MSFHTAQIDRGAGACSSSRDQADHSVSSVKHDYLDMNRYSIIFDHESGGAVHGGYSITFRSGSKGNSILKGFKEHTDFSAAAAIATWVRRRKLATSVLFSPSRFPKRSCVMAPSSSSGLKTTFGTLIFCRSGGTMATPRPEAARLIDMAASLTCWTILGIRPCLEKSSITRSWIPTPAFDEK